MPPLTRDSLPRGPRLLAVEVPEWGGTVHVRPVSALARLELGDLYGRLEDRPERERNLAYALALILATACDASGALLFRDTPEDRALLEAEGSAFQRLADAALQHNGMGRAAREGAEKNSASGPGGASPSGSA